MKALACKQPFASLIAKGLKTIEIRTWFTNYRGPLVIVASSQQNREAAARLARHVSDTPRSCVVGVVDLVDIRPLRMTDLRAALAVEWRDDWLAWVLRNARETKRANYTQSRVMTFDIPDNLVKYK